jgi:hypothetical protein
MKTEVPQWVVDYNNAGHQSSAGKAVAILFAENEKLKKSNEELTAAVIEAQWFVDHVMGKEKRIDWGKSYNIDWARLNAALITISKVTFHKQPSNLCRE